MSPLPLFNQKQVYKERKRKLVLQETRTATHYFNTRSSSKRLPVFLIRPRDTHNGLTHRNEFLEKEKLLLKEHNNSIMYKSLLLFYFINE